MDIMCKHVEMKKYEDRGLYIYHINSKQSIMLCEDCNMDLAGEMARQQAMEVFMHGPVICSCKICQDEERRCDEEMFKKINTKEVKKNVRKRRSGTKGRGKKGKD